MGLYIERLKIVEGRYAVHLSDPSDVLAHMQRCLSTLDSLGYAASAALLAQAIYQLERLPKPQSLPALSSVSEIDCRVNFAVADAFFDELYHK